MRGFFVPLALALGLGTAQAQPYGVLLGQYRAAPGCQGSAYAAVQRSVSRAYTAYHVAPLTPASVALGRVAAARIYGLAAVAAAKGCKSLANEIYWFLLRRFDGPAFAPWQTRAVHDIAALRR